MNLRERILQDLDLGFGFGPYISTDRKGVHDMTKKLKSGPDMLKLLRDLVETTDSRAVFMIRAQKLIKKHCPMAEETAMTCCAQSIGLNSYGNNFTKRDKPHIAVPPSAL